jgi:hypothetical protein
LKNPTSCLLAALLFAASTGAFATCPIASAGYAGGSYGVQSAAPAGCFEPVAGGTGQLQATSLGGGGSASASLLTGVLTAFSAQAPGYPSAALWDTFTFQGLPAGGGQLTETIALTGGITGAATGSVRLSVGDPNSPSAQASLFLTAATGVPGSFSLSFTAYNDVPVLVFAALSGYNGYSGGTVDLLDPPTLSIVVPAGVSYSAASGVFNNVGPVPEPAHAALLLAGLVLIAKRVRRRQPGA